MQCKLGIALVWSLCNLAVTLPRAYVRVQRPISRARKAKRKHVDVTWPELEALDPWFTLEAKKLAFKYGYSVEGNDRDLEEVEVE